MPGVMQLFKLFSGIAEIPEEGQLLQFGTNRLDGDRIYGTNALHTAAVQSVRTML